MIIMNKNEKDFMEQLSGFDDEYVEEIAENYPVLDENEKKRILKQCLQKSGLPDGDIEVTENTEPYEENEEDEISVSGIERYNRPLWHKYAGSVAALAIAVVGIASVVVLHGNINVDDDFDLSTPPVVSTEYQEAIQVTEIVSGSYIDKGYRADGFDYANQNDYQGKIVGAVTTPPPPEVGHVVDEGEPDNNVPEQNNQPETPPPATNPPATNPPATSPQTTAQPITTAQTVTTAPPVTTALDVTQPVSSEAQRTFLDSLYYVEVSGIGEYMGFNFSPDGSLTKYIFDEYGNAISDTAVTISYEIIENQFSYTSTDGFKRTGTILNPNDTGNFTVKFDDGEVYNFSMQRPDFRVLIFLEGTNWFWNDDSNNILEIEFADSVSGNYIIYPSDVTITESTKIPFTYEKDGYEITFHIEDPACNVLRAQLIVPEPFGQYLFGVAELEKVTLAVEYTDGSIKYFHNGN